MNKCSDLILTRVQFMNFTGGILWHQFPSTFRRNNMNSSISEMEEVSGRNTQEGRRSKTIALLSIIVGISGSALVSAAGLSLVGNYTLSFLLAGLGSLGTLSTVALNFVAITLGLVLIGTSVGLWYLKMWALVVGLTVSIVQVVISAYALNFYSFEFIRGMIVFVALLRFNSYFRMK
jgi:hypothetical protein